MVYSFKCKNCNYIFDVFNIKVEERDSKEVQCPICKVTDCKRVMASCSFSFGENYNKLESVKPDSYWDKAEQQRLAKLDRARKERYDKVMSGDPEMTQKLRNKMNNEYRLGKEMNDQVRIDEAKAVGNLIGEQP